MLTTNSAERGKFLKFTTLSDRLSLVRSKVGCFLVLTSSNIMIRDDVSFEEVRRWLAWNADRLNRFQQAINNYPKTSELKLTLRNFLRNDHPF